MSDSYLMTEHKLLWHLDRLNDWMKGKPIVPLHIELGISSGCTSNCIFCYGKFYGQEKKNFDMPTETLLQLFRDAKRIGVKSITLVGAGENTLHKDFYKIIKQARDIELDLGIATNGILLKTDKILDFVKSFVWIRFSICGATKDSYLDIHRVDKFDRVIENIQKCVEIKKQFNLTTTIGMQMVVTTENENDIIPLAKLGKDIGVDYLVIKPCSDSPDKKLDVNHDRYLELADVLNEAKSYSTKNYSVIIKWEKLFNRGVNQFENCYGPAFVIDINPHGEVAPCSHLLGYRKEEFNMGNLTKQSFEEIVNSKKYWDVQMKVQQLDVNKECETNCFHNGMNIFLDKLKHPPQHINFP